MPRVPKALRVVLFALGGIAGVLIIASLGVAAFFDLDDHKPRVEAAASGALGMDVKVEGGLRMRFLPGLHVLMENVRVRNQGSQLAYIESADLAFEILPLLRGELRYKNIGLERVRFTIERGRDQRYNYQKPQGPATQFGGLDLERIAFSSLVLHYVDKASGTGFETGNCSGELNDLRHPGGAAFLKRLSLAGQVSCDEVRGKERTMSDLKFTLAATDGVFDFKPLTMRLAGGRGSGSVRVDRSAEVQAVRVEYSLSDFRIEQYLQKQQAERVVKGVMDFSTTLSMRGQTRVELKRSAHGEMSLSGNNLALSGVDLDQVFGKYAASQEFNVLDLGAMLIAGPFGFLATKGYELSTLSERSGGGTQIRTMVSRWKVEKGVAHARDVAMATAQNRVAVQGGLDFVRGEYSDMVMAQIDANGCAMLRQRVTGPFAKPVVEKPGVIKSLAGPAVNLLGKAREALTGESRCEPFYRGSVAQPK